MCVGIVVRIKYRHQIQIECIIYRYQILFDRNTNIKVVCLYRVSGSIFKERWKKFNKWEYVPYSVYDLPIIFTEKKNT